MTAADGVYLEKFTARNVTGASEALVGKSSDSLEVRVGAPTFFQFKHKVCTGISQLKWSIPLKKERVCQLSEQQGDTLPWNW
jgi:hypothetical protein